VPSNLIVSWILPLTHNRILINSIMNQTDEGSTLTPPVIIKPATMHEETATQNVQWDDDDCESDDESSSSSDDDADDESESNVGSDESPIDEGDDDDDDDDDDEYGMKRGIPPLVAPARFACVECSRPPPPSTACPLHTRRSAFASDARAKAFDDTATVSSSGVVDFTPRPVARHYSMSPSPHVSSSAHAASAASASVAAASSAVPSLAHSAMDVSPLSVPGTQPAPTSVTDRHETTQHRSPPTSPNPARSETVSNNHSSTPPLSPPSSTTRIHCSCPHAHLPDHSVYRGSYPTLPNFHFLSRLKLRSIIALTPEPPNADLVQFCAQGGRMRRFPHSNYSGTSSTASLQAPGESRRPPVRLYHFPMPQWTPNAGVCVSMKQAVACVQILIHAQDCLPAYIYCTDCLNHTALIIACLRKLQGWTMTAILAEFLRYTRNHTGILDAERTFIEQFNHGSIQDADKKHASVSGSSSSEHAKSKPKSSSSSSSHYLLRIPRIIPSWLWRGMHIGVHPFGIQLYDPHALTDEHQSLQRPTSGGRSRSDRDGSKEQVMRSNTATTTTTSLRQPTQNKDTNKSPSTVRDGYIGRWKTVDEEAARMDTSGAQATGDIESGSTRRLSVPHPLVLPGDENVASSEPPSSVSPQPSSSSPPTAEHRRGSLSARSYGSSGRLTRQGSAASSLAEMDEESTAKIFFETNGAEGGDAEENTEHPASPLPPAFHTPDEQRDVLSPDDGTGGSSPAASPTHAETHTAANPTRSTPSSHPLSQPGEYHRLVDLEKSSWERVRSWLTCDIIFIPGSFDPFAPCADAMTDEKTVMDDSCFEPPELQEEQFIEHPYDLDDNSTVDEYDSDVSLLIASLALEGFTMNHKLTRPITLFSSETMATCLDDTGTNIRTEERRATKEEGANRHHTAQYEQGGDQDNSQRKHSS